MEDTWKRTIAKRKRLIIVIAIIAVIVVSGFVAGLMTFPSLKYGPGWSQPETTTEATITTTAPLFAPTPTPSPMPPKEDSTPSLILEVADRKIIYNAWMSLEVQNVDGAVSQIKGIVDGVDGYISQMTVSNRVEVKTGSVTLRVPQANFFTAIERIEQIGKVKDKNIGSEDVSQQYIDLKARLENAQSEEKRLLEIMNKAYQISDMLEIERELNRIREQIEIYTGQLTYLEGRVDYATITVALSEPSPPAPLPEVNWDATVKNGLQGLFIIVQGLILLAFVIIPLVIVGVPIYYVYRRRGRKNQT